MKYKIPLFELNFNHEEETALLETLRSQWISTGPRTDAFENKFSEMLGVKHSLALTNCTVSLHMAFEVLGIKENDEVICPSLTFVATVNSIMYVKAKPVFCDIRSYDDLTIDPDMIESLITDRTKAIIVMHYAGFPCDMNRITEIAQKYNLKIIEDACHGPLSEYNGKKLGTIGDVGCFSFFANKNISTGEGGMLITNDTEFFERAKLLRSHGMTSLSYERSKGHSTSYDVVDLGFNYRMDDMRASLGLVQLNKIQKFLEKRAEVRINYLNELSGIDELIIPFQNNHEFVSNYIFPIVLNESTSAQREFIREELHSAGIQTSVHYPAVHKFSIYEKNHVALEKTEYVSDNEITLPMYASLDSSKVGFIAQILKSALVKASSNFFIFTSIMAAI